MTKKEKNNEQKATWGTNMEGKGERKKDEVPIS